MIDECNIYIETSLSFPKKGDGIVGIIFTDHDDEHSKQLFGTVKDMTSHEAVLIGIKTALQYTDAFKVIHLHLSSPYAAGSLKYIPSWQANGWITSRGNPVKYANIWQEIAKKMQNKEFHVHLNEVNGYRRWLRYECDNRGRKHGFIL